MRVIKVINNEVTETKQVLEHYIFQENEIQSNFGEVGQIMQENGAFITPEPIPFTPTLTLEEQVESLKQDNLIMMDVLATMYEDMLAKVTV